MLFIYAILIIMKKKISPVTMEQLARIIKKGFDETASKDELKSLRNEMENRFGMVDRRFEDMDRQFQGLSNRMENIESRLGTVERDIKDIKIALGALVRTVAQMDGDIHNLQSRMLRLERKAGITK